MTATGHALIATLLVAKFQNPYISLPLAFASHFACDILPHWDAGTHRREKTKKQLFFEATLDVVVSIISASIFYAYLGGENYILLYVAVFISQLPDWLTAPYLILHIKHPLAAWSKSTYKLQHALNNQLDKPWGIITQIGAVVLLYILLFVIF